MRKLLLIVLIISNSILLFSQINEHGIPFIKNYSIKDYKASEQNWAIIQDSRGILYVGNQDGGVLEYDGERWRKIKLANNSSIRSLALDSNNNVFVGAVSEFGQLVPNSIGFLEYKSLIPLLDSSERNFGDVWRTYTSKEGVFFTTFNKIYKYNYDNIIQIDVPKGAIFSFYVKDNLYCGSVFSGLNIYDHESDAFKIAKGGDFFKGKRIASILPYNESSMIVSGYEKGSFIYNYKTGKSKTLHHSNSNNLLLKSGLYHGASITTNSFAFATMFKGFTLIDSLGNTINHLDQNNGLQDDMASYIYSNINNKQSPIWLALNNGISKIEINNPIKFFKQISDINDIISFNNQLFVATGEGVFVKKINANNKPYFERVGSYVGASWSFYGSNHEDDALLLAAADGVYQVNKIKTTQIISKQDCRVLFVPKTFPNRLYIGTSNGLFMATKHNKQWFDNGFFGDIPYEIHSITEDTQGNLWLGTYLNGVIKVNQHDTTTVKYGVEHGLPNLKSINIIEIDDRVVIATEKGLLAFDEKTNHFEPYTAFGCTFISGKKGVLKLMIDRYNTIWSISFHDNEHWIEQLIKDESNTYKHTFIPFKRLPNMTYQSLYTDDRNITWIGGSEGLFSFNNNHNRSYHFDYSTYVRKVIIGRDSVIYGGINFSIDEKGNKSIVKKQNVKQKAIIDYALNSITYEFATPFFENEEANLYRWCLKGFDKQWSNWSTQNNTTYNNLFEGEYKFQVKAKNVYGIESNIAEYSFTIKPPYYRTKLAYIIYILFFIIGIQFIIKYNVRRLQREKIHLEGIVKERTAEVVKQKEKIELAYQNVKLLSKIGQDVTANLSVEKIVEVVYENVNNLMDASILAVGLKSKHNNSLVFLGKEQNDGELLRMSDSLDDVELLSTKCFIYKKEIIINNLSIENLESIKLYSEEQKYRKSLIYLPLKTKEQTIGVITVQSFKENSYSEYHINILRNLAVYISIALDNAEAYQQIAKQKKEITDSIQYAKRIQNAVLPPMEQIKETFPEHFIFFKPRDIVSGDFYWMKQINQYSVIAAADCTGHGVPGAFMSMLGIAFLNEIAARKNIQSASDILNELRRYVKVSLRQTGKEGETKDGMDIALCVIDSNTNELQYSGAYNPFLLYRNEELFEIKADKMPIGIHIREKDTFTNNIYELKKNDVFYIFSDGYPDQFGGKLNRKFKMKRFKDLLTEIHKIPMEEQKEILDKTMSDWMGNGEQIDDITIIGIRI